MNTRFVIAMSTKEAVVFVLDAHPSMSARYPSNATDETSSRLSCAKEALEGMISQLMIQSKQNEVGVIVLNTEAVKTEDGWDDGAPSNPHLTELSLPCVTRPSVELLRAVRRVKCASRNFHRVDVCKGLVVAEQALRQRTFKKKFARRLVVFTDAAHKVESSNEDLLQVIDRLRELDCTLTVIGVCFEHSAKFEEPLAAEQAAGKGEEDEEEVNENEGGKSDSDDSDTTAGESMDDEDNPLTIKRMNEQLLISVARLTGGSVIAASTMKEIVESTFGKRIPKSAKKNIQLNIAPGLKLEAKCSLLLSKAPFPSLKKDVIQLDESGQPMIDGNDEVMTNAIVTDTSHWDADNKDMEVPPENRTSAFRYGVDFIPMSSLDYVGLKLTLSDPAIRILGYTEQSIVPRSVMIGPPYAISGGDSHRACCAIAALSQALHRLHKVAICTFVKTKHADPVLGALFPLQEETKSQPTRLFFIQVPFANDMRQFNMLPLEASLEDTEERSACDNLIDSFMLSPDTLRSEQIANPAIRSFHKTVKNRAIDPSSSTIIPARDRQSLDLMSTPCEVLERAASSLEAFRKAFPRKRVVESDDSDKKKPRYWTEHDV